MANGTVKWFNEQSGYGYITQENGGSLLVRSSEIRSSGFPYLEEGDRVRFDVVKGKLCDAAVGVSLICNKVLNINRV